MNRETLEQLRKTHPTPQWVRERFQSLDGKWELNGHDIRVPYPPQAEMSGYHHHVGFHLHYHKRFQIPKNFIQDRILLHFGAVDQVCDVYLNERYLGHHEGGYLGFSFDITDFVNREGENRLTVSAVDRLSHTYPYGKQRFARGGMWYTPVSGIWKSVWLENVPSVYLDSAKFTPDGEGFEISVKPSKSWNQEDIYAEFYFAGHKAAVKLENLTTYISLREFYETLHLAWNPEEVLWSVDHPNLFDVSLRCGEDVVESYVALREITIEKIRGVNRVCLNHEPIFLQGVLDQGYFPEGIYVPSDRKKYDADIKRMKALGFNFLRKHIKVEPEYFYYAADRLGILVMQDMVNSGPYHFFIDTLAPNITFKKRGDERFRKLDLKRKNFFIYHCEETVRALYNHPCIISWCIFNEGWGQFESDRIYRLMKGWDGTRLVDSTSGWFAEKLSDFDSEHIYFHNERLIPKERPMLLSECGGFGYQIQDHLFNIKKIMGYGMCESTEELMHMIRTMYVEMIYPAISKGMCGVVYTQLSDVEDEVNGIYTYDRHVCKVDTEEMRRIAKHCFDILDASCKER